MSFIQNGNALVSALPFILGSFVAASYVEDDTRENSANLCSTAAFMRD